MIWAFQPLLPAAEVSGETATGVTGEAAQTVEVLQVASGTAEIWQDAAQ